MIRTSLRTIACCALLLAGIPSRAAAREDPPIGLELTGFEDVRSGPTNGDQHRGRWQARFGGAELLIDLVVVEEGPGSPEEMLNLVHQHRAQEDRAAGRPLSAFEEMHAVSGPFGWAPYARVGVASLRENTRAVATLLFWAGLLERGAYVVEVTARPALQPKEREKLEKALAGAIAYKGKSYDPKWSEEEVEARWQACAPDVVLEKSKLTVVRTEHYLIMTNVAKGTAGGFAEKLEECYEAIAEVYAFEAIEGQRLLPVFYFVTPDQYYEWCIKNLGWNREVASRSKGVASGDAYSTYHEATGDPVHIHEATHQIFANRLGLGGGGSWFQEGVAEYMSSQPNDLVVVGNVIKKGRHVPLAEFVVIPSLLDLTPKSEEEVAKGGGDGGEAANNYDQAAALIEFVRHGAFCKGKFDAFIHSMGGIAPGDQPEIERALQRIFGVDLAGFDAEFVKYWDKRKKPKKK